MQTTLKSISSKLLAAVLAVVLSLVCAAMLKQQAYADDAVLHVSASNCQAIAEDSYAYDMDTDECGSVYYLSSDAAVSAVTIDDLAGNFSMISNWAGDTSEFVNQISIAKLDPITFAELTEDESIELFDGVEGLDFSHAYGVWAFDTDWNTYRFILNLPNAVVDPEQPTAPTEKPANPISFKALVDGVEQTNIVETQGGYKYCTWMNELYVANLYTVQIPEGTTEVTLKLPAPCLVYNYKENQALGYQIDDDYLAGAVKDPTVGSPDVKAEVAVPVDANKDGVLDFIQIQDPYSADYVSGGELRIALTFEYVPADQPPAGGDDNGGNNGGANSGTNGGNNSGGSNSGTNGGNNSGSQATTIPATGDTAVFVLLFAAFVAVAAVTGLSLNRRFNK